MALNNLMSFYKNPNAKTGFIKRIKDRTNKQNSENKCTKHTKWKIEKPKKQKDLWLDRENVKEIHLKVESFISQSHLFACCILMCYFKWN